jgi:hypothetical protein
MQAEKHVVPIAVIIKDSVSSIMTLCSLVLNNVSNETSSYIVR